MEDHQHHCKSDKSNQELDKVKLLQRLNQIKHKIVILSGKGGVGKSTVAVNIASALVLEGKRVGLLDIDIHGPSIPTMLGLENTSIQITERGLEPVMIGDLAVISIGFFLKNRDDAVIWRGPMKMNIIRQFLTDVEWGDLDYLIIDSPPGTGDEPLSLCQLIGTLDGAIIITTPQKVAEVDVRKSITFCRQLNVPVLGIVENMSGFVCPHCGETADIFSNGAGSRIAMDMNIPFLGRIPMDSRFAEASDQGHVLIHEFKDCTASDIFRQIIQGFVKPGTNVKDKPLIPNTQKEELMRIALPVSQGKLCLHFGHCEKFVLIDVDQITKTILSKQIIDAPPHQPGLLPPWLAEQKVNIIIAGGMGQRAQDLFCHHGIKVVVGASSDTPDNLVSAYLQGTLETGSNVCDH